MGQPPGVNGTAQRVERRSDAVPTSDESELSPAPGPGSKKGTQALREAVGVSMSDVGRAFEDEGVAPFTKSFDKLFAALDAKRAELDSP